MKKTKQDPGTRQSGLKTNLELGSEANKQFPNQNLAALYIDAYKFQQHTLN